MNRYATILSTGRYVPERRITNADLEAQLGQPLHEWLVKNVGIEARHHMAKEQVTSDLAVAAGTQALERAGVKAAELDLVIVASDTPDYISPGTASAVQHKLGAVSAGAYDVNCACASWVTALDIAAKTLAADESYLRILVVGAYAMSRFLDPKVKNTATLFADGAGAVVLGASDRPGFLGAKLFAKGEYHDALGIYTGGTFRPATAQNVAQFGPPHVQFVRKFPATFNTERWPELIRDLANRQRMSVADISFFVFAQLNLRTIEATMEVLGRPMSKTHWTMDKWGYTGSACIPMTLDDAVGQGKVRAGDTVMFCASGGGLSMAAALFRWAY